MKQSLLLIVVLVTFCAACFSSGSQPEGGNIFKDCRQLTLVISPDDNSTSARMWWLERVNDRWQLKGDPHDVMLGRSGLAWGRGLHPGQDGLQKREGDGKSPAGIFSFGTAFGHATPSAVSFKVPYVQVTGTLECVDDSGSEFYNQIVDNQEVKKDWSSSERMLEVGPQYGWGIFVNHNDPAQAKGGSCIFLHVWGRQGMPTSGCTAMTEENMLTFLHWLDSEKKPLLVQLTQAHFPDFQKKYGLPDLL
jgi:D-alanyl-D-alanine dipeptidase